MPYLTTTQKAAASVLVAAFAALAAYVLLAGRNVLPTTCVAVDVTSPALLPMFEADLEITVRQVARDAGKVKVLPFAGSPKTESVPIEATFHGLSTHKVRREVRRVLDDSSVAVLDLQPREGRTKRQRGSGVIDAMDKVVDGDGCGGGLLLLSDTLEGRAFDVYRDDFLTASGRKDVVDRITDNGALPELRDVMVTIPYGGIVPEGSVISKAPKRVNALKRLYTAIVEAGGGRLKWGV